jgi:hypothetical protein
MRIVLLLAEIAFGFLLFEGLLAISALLLLKKGTQLPTRRRGAR